MNQELDLCSKRVEINSIGHVFCSIADVNVKKKIVTAFTDQQLPN